MGGVRRRRRSATEFARRYHPTSSRLSRLDRLRPLRGELPNSLTSHTDDLGNVGLRNVFTPKVIHKRPLRLREFIRDLLHGGLEFGNARRPGLYVVCVSEVVYDQFGLNGGQGNIELRGNDGARFVANV